MKPIRNTYWILIAMVAFFTMAASSPQCARFNDTALSPQSEVLLSGKGAVADCVAACVDAAKVARTEEQARHKLAVAACEEDFECLEEEEALHTSIMQEIAADSRDCKKPCHEQGGGSGGQ